VSRQFRISAGYEYKNKFNISDSLVRNASVDFHKIVLESKLNLGARNNLFVKTELADVIQRGSASYSAEYELRESLAKGINGIWQIFLTWYINKSLELGITYDGRVSAQTKPIHAGRVQLKAYF
jgi:hypothetical protein